jgi:ribosomal protein L11 methyltransferase
MRWHEVRVIFDAPQPALAADLIAELFYRQDVKGVVIDDPELETAEEWAGDAQQRPAYHAVTAYYAQTKGLATRLEQLHEGLEAHMRRMELTYRIEVRRVAEEDWAEAWKTYFKPVKISARMVVRPTWHDYRPQGDEIVIDLDPGMAFGTGTHATTCLCMQKIEQYLRPGHDFLDIGTGSGILMVGAAKLGARYVYGVDNDPVAVEVAQRNLALNRIERDCATVAQGDLADNIDRQFDLVAANILSAVIIKLLYSIADVLKPEGVFIASGIVVDNQAAVVDRMAASGLQLLNVLTEQEWVVISARRLSG